MTGPSLSVAREREALSRRRQAASDHPADIARRAASLERARNAKRAKLASESKEERAVRLAKRRKRDHNRRLRQALQESATAPAAVDEEVNQRTDDKDLQRPLHSLAQELYSNQKAQEGKVDCWLQTDGTGKIDCFVQTEDAVKSASEVPTEKCMKVVAVQTEECPELQFYEPTCDATQYESECPSAVGTESEDWL
ncbi:uncharacterized protein LOC142564648 isoform X5 [Dermacentor variabilis]|uniref:uncharacterized protein LOC142564648 isoform X5 n=1 Tax=Dermacentor variabilis TaxID=34621 RepID=UPI003F5BC286